jgi:lipopolysaccharide biosynthesis protein
MFWIRSSLLTRFLDLDLTWDDYPAEPLPIDGTMLHAIERLLGVVAELDGNATLVTNVRGVSR